MDEVSLLNRLAAVERLARRLLDGTLLNSQLAQGSNITLSQAGSVITIAGSSGGDSVTVNGNAVADVDLDDATPAAPAGGVNAKWQKDASTPPNASAYIDWAGLSAAFRVKPFWATDFFSSDVDLNQPWLGAALASGTINSPNAGLVTAHHPGVQRVASSTSANSGYRHVFDTAGVLVGGGEIFEFIFNPTDLSSNTTMRFGLIDTVNQNDATDGVYFEVSSGTIKGKTASNSTRSTTGTTYTPSTGTWYRAKLTINSGATSILFEVYSDAGSLLWSDTLTTNIPTASGRETGCGYVISNAGTSAIDLAHVDYMALYQNDRALTR